MRPHVVFTPTALVRACKLQRTDGQRVQKSPGEVPGGAVVGMSYETSLLFLFAARGRRRGVRRG